MLKTVRVALSPGDHVVQAFIDFAGSPETVINVRQGETLTVQVGPSRAIPGMWSLDRPSDWLSVKVRSRKFEPSN